VNQRQEGVVHTASQQMY